MAKKYDAEKLWQKYRAQLCTEEEKAIVESWHTEELATKTVSITEEEQNRAHKRMRYTIKKKIGRPVSVKLSYPLKQWAVAASLLLVLSFATYYFYITMFQQPVDTSAYAYVPPGGNKATLTLANGRSILLSENKGGIVIHSNEITYNDGSDLTAVTQSGTAASYHKIMIPPGGQYRVVLADGTKVWLNAASTLRYPSAFMGKKRVVELTGEAYFEVAKADSPFIVKTSHQEVEVLGTHFNINAYEDEGETITTLLEGRVRIAIQGADFSERKPNQVVVLKPHEQSILKKGGDYIQVNAIDTSSFVAWKNGYFVFNKDDIHAIMRMVARWYDVDVEYAPHVTQERISGSIARSVNLSEMLNMLELTGLVRFKVIKNDGFTQERRIVVM